LRVRQQAVSRVRCLGFALRLHPVLATIALLALPVGAASSEPTTRQQSSPPQAKTSVTDELTARRQRAESGDADAQYDLGVAYANGYGVPQDYARSALWYLKGAQQGLAKAQHELGSLYLSGQGVETDRAEALMWLGLEEASVASTEKEALGAAIRKLAATMTRKEVAEAQKRARQWVRESARRGSLAGGVDLTTLFALRGIDASSLPPDARLRSDLVVPPRLRDEVRPIYTKAAAERWIEGEVLLACVVESNGAVGECQVVRSLDASFGLDQQAVDAARTWRFDPARRGSAAVPVMVKIELTFTMGGSPRR